MLYDGFHLFGESFRTGEVCGLTDTLKDGRLICGLDSNAFLMLFVFVCFIWFLNNKIISWTGPKTERLAILRAATHETELGDHDFCLSR